MDTLQQSPLVRIDAILTRSASLDVAIPPHLNPGSLNTSVALDVKPAQIKDGQFEVTVDALASVTTQAGSPAFTVKASVSAVATIHNVPANEIDFLLKVFLPNTVFPYIRELISDLSVRAGYPALLLPPVQAQVPPPAPQPSSTQLH